MSQLIRPALEDGMIVVCDRFSDSTMAYQGIARGLGLENISQLNDFATGGLLPDITFLLDADPQKLEERRSRRRFMDRMELEKGNFQERVREGFLLLQQQNQNRIFKLNALDSVGKIRSEIIDVFEKFLEKM